VQVESTPKDYKARSVPIPKSILDELAVLVAGRRADEPVFRGSRSGSWVRGKVFRRGWLDKAAVLTGEPGLTPHELRHTAASIAVSLGANVKAVQRMLGHASAAVTLDVYADLFDADTDALSAALDRVASRPIASISRPRAVEGGE
jgi:integrase